VKGLCFEEIQKQINVVTKSSIDQSNNSGPNTTSLKSSIITSINQPIAVKWSSNEVLNWMNEKSISPYLIKKLKVCDGELLFHLFNDYNTMPNFFYQQFLNESNSNNLDYIDLARFTLELKKLFQS
jgi:hypothetical protein